MSPAIVIRSGSILLYLDALPSIEKVTENISVVSSVIDDRTGVTLVEASMGEPPAESGFAWDKIVNFQRRAPAEVAELIGAVLV